MNYNILDKPEPTACQVASRRKAAVFRQDNIDSARRVKVFCQILS
jgi:hypothetical protein